MSEGVPTPDMAVLAEVLDGLRRGVTRTYACQAAGTTRRTLSRWIDAHPDVKLAVLQAEAHFYALVVPDEEQVAKASMRDRVALMKFLLDREQRPSFTPDQQRELAELEMRKRRAETDEAEARAEIARAKIHLLSMGGADEWDTFAKELEQDGVAVLPPPRKKTPTRATAALRRK